MANHREIGYENLLKMLAEKNVSTERFADLRGIEHAEFLKTVTNYLLALQEAQEAKNENNELMREMQKYITLNEKIDGEMQMYEKKSAKLEMDVADWEAKIFDLTKNCSKKITELADKFESLEDIYHLSNIKSELMNVQCKKETVTVELQANVKVQKQLKAKFDLIQTEIPNFNGVFDEAFEREKLKNCGDLATNRKRLSDIKKSYDELSRKTEKLNQ